MLTDQQLLNAVELFAQGVPRSHIAQLHIDDPTEAVQAVIDEIGEPAAKERIASELRSADPTSSKFAKTKYLDHYESHVTTLRRAMNVRYDQLIAAQIRESQLITGSLAELIEEVQHNLNSAEEPEPTGNAEWNNTIRTLTTLLKVQSEHNARTESLISKFAVGMPEE